MHNKPLSNYPYFSYGGKKFLLGQYRKEENDISCYSMYFWNLKRGSSIIQNK